VARSLLAPAPDRSDPLASPVTAHHADFAAALPTRAAPAQPEAPRLVRRAYALLGVTLFAVYLPTLARGVTFSDGPELVTAVRTLGVGHPTGYPIFILAAHAFCALLPLPVLYCVKIEIFNALCGAAGSVLAAFTARALARHAGAEGRDADVGGLVAGLLLGVSPMLWGQLHIPEVYALHFFLVAWAGYAWMRFELTGREAYILGAALPMGLGLAHHVTMVYMLPAAFLYLLARRPSFFTAWLTTPAIRLVRRFRPAFRAGRAPAPAWGFLAACVIGFVPLLSYGFLIWANSHSTGVPWGDVNGWDNLYNHFTGKQYQGFMRSFDAAEHWRRFKQVPDIFDQQFLPGGTVLLLVGLVVTFRRAWRPALFFFAFLVFNAAHGIHYSVGDFGTYYIPGIYACAVFMGPGCAWLLGFARARPPAQRPWLTLGSAAAMLTTAAISVWVYARFTKRLPAAVGAHWRWLVVPCAALALVAFVGAVLSLRERALRGRVLPVWALPAVLLGGLAAAVFPAAIARAGDLVREPIIGESYGAEVAGGLPPGAVLMTQGDGFIFTMWYENHVQGRAVDAAVLDMGNLRTSWFQRYVRTHHPASCDPLVLTPAAFAARCDTYEKRMRLGDAESWASMGLIGNRRPFPGVAAAKTPILRGEELRCEERVYREAHAKKECRCHGYGKSAAALEGMLEEDCVSSAEDRGVVPREPVEIFAQRIIEDNLDERPVFERNVLTGWTGPKDNPRGWDGPTYQRLSGEYALLNRGRFNEVVYARELEGIDPCAGERLRPWPARTRVKPRGAGKGQDRRRAYVPNVRPTIIGASYLTKRAEERDDDATRVFAPGEKVIAHVDWFEKFHWDVSRPDRRGAELKHGVRFCVFDPEGRKVATKLARSGPGEHAPVVLMDAAPGTEGVYRVQACTTGELGSAPLATAEAKACQWMLLDYELTVKVGKR
jgi:hypothetical protein